MKTIVDALDKVNVQQVIGSVFRDSITGEASYVAQLREGQGVSFYGYDNSKVLRSSVEGMFRQLRFKFEDRVYDFDILESELTFNVRRIS
jgi:hypothetical protein